MQAYRVDVFTTEPGKGNPALVVMAPEGLSGPEMAGIAARYGLETTFVTGDTLRYYLPAGAPMTLCGHGTLAALAVMGREGQFQLQTPAGAIIAEAGPHLYGMTMPAITQADPVDPSVAAEALGIAVDQIDGPVQPVGAGRPKLIVPLRSTEELDSIVPDSAAIDALCARLGVTGIYPFTLNARTFGVLADARQFPAGAGLVEDPVTGTAAAALAYYLWTYGVAPGCTSIKIEQGHAMGRPGIAMIRQCPNGTWLYGQAVVVEQMEV